MYKVLTVEDRVLIPPRYISGDVAQSIHRSLSDTLVGNVGKHTGVVLSIDEVVDIGEGYIEPENPGVFYDATYTVTAFMPELHEVVMGEVTTITEFGAFVRIGPVEGLCHISQIMDDYVSFDEKQERIASKDGDHTIDVGDIVLARITAVGLDTQEISKINLTMRQPGLGAMKWLYAAEEQKQKEEQEEGEG